MDETVILSERLTLRYVACAECLGNIARRLSSYWQNDAKISGICYDLDDIYINWLQRGRERVLRMSCPHLYEEKICYYLKGKARINLGTRIMYPHAHDYENVRVRIRLSDRVREKLIDRHYPLPIIIL